MLSCILIKPNSCFQFLFEFGDVCRYKKYVYLDPLSGAVTKTHNTLETEKEEKPFDAPLSITKREQLERQVSVRNNQCRLATMEKYRKFVKKAVHCLDVVS